MLNNISNKISVLFLVFLELVGKAKEVAGYYLSYYFLDKHSKKFIRHNLKKWKSYKIEGSKNIILFDYHPLSETEIARSYLLNILSKKHDACIASYSFNKIRKNYWDKVYRSFNVNKHVLVKLSDEQKKESRKIFDQILPSIKNKMDVFNLTIFDVWLGVDIYEEYLMRYTEPTFILEDPRAIKIIQEGIDALVFWKEYFEINEVKAIVSSHIGVRIEKNLPCKIAGQLFNIPFYSTHARSVTHLPQAHHHYKYVANRYKLYREKFKKLPEVTQDQGIKWAKTQLDRRLSGEIGVDMPWNTKSSFVYDKNSNNSIINKSNNVKILICPHEFYDSPNCYGGLLFPDFYEWLLYLGSISERTNYDWYVKTHPDVLDNTKEVINSIVSKYSRLTLIPPETSHHKLVDEGVSFVLTCYGSVGHEYPLLGAQVINAGNNPHMGYDFNWHPKTLDEYEKLLLNLKTLKKDVNIQDIYEFYYMHYKEQGPIDNWIYKSYQSMLVDLTLEERFGSHIFTYFLNEIDEYKHEEIISRFNKYIDSGKIGHATPFDLYEK